MPYTQEQIDNLAQEYKIVLDRLQALYLCCVQEGQAITDQNIREHIIHGSGRRLAVLRRSIENIYSLFPPETNKKLSREVLSDVQINLHAFVINLYGFFENCAWAFVLRHNLVAEVGSPKRIGIFNAATKKYLPPQLKEYAESEVTAKWFDRYLKEYRDSLAHRIPLYIPPFEVTEQEGRKLNALSGEKLDCMRDGNWERLNAIYAEEEEIGEPYFSFLHAFSREEPLRPILLHPQLVCDGKLVIEFGNLFFKHWHERA